MNKTPQEQLLDMGVNPDWTAPIAPPRNNLEDAIAFEFRKKAMRLLREVHGEERVPIEIEGVYSENGILINWAAKAANGAIILDSIAPKELAEELYASIQIAYTNSLIVRSDVPTSRLPTNATVLWKV